MQLFASIPSSFQNTVVRHTLACAAGLVLGLASVGASAQVTTAPDQAATQPQTQLATQPQGRTRAEVIAELECARASGEMEAALMKSYGLYTERVQKTSCATALASERSQPLTR